LGSVVWDNIVGRHLWQQQRGQLELARIAAGRFSKAWKCIYVPKWILVNWMTKRLKD
jgi:hypothetical protein